MRLFYICNEDTAQALSRLTSDYHYLNLANGQVIVSVRFTEETHELAFSNQPGVTACPHPLSGKTFGQSSIPADAMAALTQQFGVSSNDSMHAASEKLGKVVPHMRLTVF